MGRRTFSREFKLEAVKLVTERGMTASQAGRDLGIAANIVSRWVREAAADKKLVFPGRGQMKADDAEVAKLRRELARTKAERDILKKLLGSSPRSQREIPRHCKAARDLAGVLDMRSAGGHLRRVLRMAQAPRFRTHSPGCHAEHGDPAQLQRQRSHLRCPPCTTGSVGLGGHRCGIHRVERLMRTARLVARRRRRRMPFDIGPRPEHSIAPNVLERRFDAEVANRKWVADFTYLWTAEGWLYVATVMDLFSRRIVGWSMSSQMTSQLVADALLMAIWRRGPVKALLHHSDQGSQYSSEQFQRLLKEHGITCSMSRSGDCWDNAAMESFFSTLKTERTSRKNYQLRDEARADVFDYIERFYNPRRRHSTLGYLSPVNYEKMAHSG